jgi:hypothetical protein
MTGIEYITAHHPDLTSRYDAHLQVARQSTADTWTTAEAIAVAVDVAVQTHTEHALFVAPLVQSYRLAVGVPSRIQRALAVYSAKREAGITYCRYIPTLGGQEYRIPDNVADHLKYGDNALVETIRQAAEAELAARE